MPSEPVIIKGRTPRKSNKTYVHNTDLWFMLMGYIRYAMGRMSTAPGIAHNLVRDYGRSLDDRQLEQISQEIVQELTTHERMGKTLGADCDHETWKEVVKSIETQQAWRAREGIG